MQHLEHLPEQPNTTTYPSLINRIDAYLALPPNGEHAGFDPLARDLFDELNLPALALSACGQLTRQARFQKGTMRDWIP